MRPWISLTGREREEGRALPEPSLLVQKVPWVEGEGRLPLVAVEQRRGQVGDDGGSLVGVGGGSY